MATPPRVPDRPEARDPTNIGHTTFQIKLIPGDANGSAITNMQYQLSREASFGSFRGPVEMGRDGVANPGDLIPGEKYYWRGRTKNGVGYSPWSGHKSATTDAGSYIRYKGKWRKAVAYIRVKGKWRPSVPFVRRDGVWRDTD